MTHLLLTYGLALLFAVVAVESLGVPIPGETVLVTAAFLSRPEHHDYSLWSVILVAWAGTVVGGNLGYLLGRHGGRRLLQRWALVRDYADKALPPAERFFRRHGAKTVFFGRFIALLRVAAGWLAGIAHMEWWRFNLWNTAGGLLWSAAVAAIAYALGKTVADAINRYGLYAIVGLVAVAAVGWLVARFLGNRVVEGR